ncbi:hypothetical protein LIPSTDRAFT_140120 [Lipomyces starkeyi NRRL Y-11557]|uniref:Uncharacterized protein n=1 Tax=Lipomyces starkeyi NRRL Y-11557 TaxID=675824 RepID=A0A1E3QG16_LIPST|nr:hypothetical protein LIPSTDRAFT_140120 [Lipomyces starkeyi NRRL Y-11557]
MQKASFSRRPHHRCYISGTLVHQNIHAMFRAAFTSLFQTVSLLLQNSTGWRDGPLSPFALRCAFRSLCTTCCFPRRRIPSPPFLLLNLIPHPHPHPLPISTHYINRTNPLEKLQETDVFPYKCFLSFLNLRLRGPRGCFATCFFILSSGIFKTFAVQNKNFPSNCTLLPLLAPEVSLRLPFACA